MIEIFVYTGVTLSIIFWIISFIYIIKVSKNKSKYDISELIKKMYQEQLRHNKIIEELTYKNKR